MVVDLLNGHREWRECLVQEFAYASSTAEVRVTNGYQVRFPDSLLLRHVKAHHRTARMTLPLGSRDKEMLLRLDIDGPNNAPAHLVTRRTSSQLQAAYLWSLLEACDVDGLVRAHLVRARPSEHALSGASEDDWLRDLFAAICGFTPQLAENRCRDADGDLRSGLADWLNDEVALSGSIDAQLVETWLDELRPVAACFRALGEPQDELSSSQNILLALSGVPGTWSPATIMQLVQGYRRAVIAALHDLDDTSFLALLAEYGRRYELFVDVEVPLREAFTVRMSEDRPLNEPAGQWRRWRFTSRQSLALGEARTVHIEAHIDDHAVHFHGDPDLRNASGTPFAGALDGWRGTHETIALYFAHPELDQHIDLVVQLRPARLVQLTTWLLSSLNIVATVAVFAVPRDSYVERLAILSLPATVASALVLSREQSALAARLQLRSRFILILTFALLFVALLLEVFSYEERQPPLKMAGASAVVAPAR